MNLSMKQKQDQGHREQTGGCQGGGGGKVLDWFWGLADTNYYIQDG